MRPGRDFGHFGTRPGELRFPRDAAWHPSGDYILVADTYNHRIEALEPEEGRHLFSLGDAGLFHSPVSVAIDPEERIFVADVGYRRLVAWLGPDTPKPFDLYVRDFVGDEGTEPSAGLDDFVLSSPDLLVTHASGLEIERLQPDRLTDITFQQPRFERNNYVYVAVHNRGPKLAGPAQVRFYWADPATALRFPEEWSSDGFYRSYTSEASNVPASWLDVPPLWPGLGRVLGPLVFRPPDPETAVAGDGRFHLLARIVNLHDSSRDASGLEGILPSNNVARRGINVDPRAISVGQAEDPRGSGQIPGYSRRSRSWARGAPGPCSRCLAQRGELFPGRRHPDFPRAGLAPSRARVLPFARAKGTRRHDNGGARAASENRA